MNNTDTDHSGDPSIFTGGSKMPFNDSATATKHPKPRKFETPNFNVGASETPLLTKLRETFGRKNTIENTFEQQREKLEAERQRMRELAEQLNHHTNDVERAQARLARADAEFADLKERFAAYGVKVKGMWGLEPNTFTGQTIPIENHYADFAGCERAIADFPEARKPLVAAVKQQEAKLAKFRKDNDLIAED
ncbi:MAG: hypothetical protein QOE70_6374 [Chthoniobacter sp.]|jgi:chromosome segregation ATPase|nr:hypothetical protein [Chthoniobacter sp.]